MLEHIYYFIRGISSFKYDVPIYLQIAGFIALGIFATCIIMIFGDSLDKSIFKDSYLMYYILVILNIINIIVVLFYYKKKSGTFIGPEGEKGNTGLKGNVGTEVDCSLCTNNLYMKKTQQYNTICRLNNSAYLSRLLGETQNTLLNDLIANNNFNYEQFATSLLIDGFDLNNPSVIKIFNYINAFEFLLYRNINSSLGTSSSQTTGYFRRPNIPIGNYSLGDTATGGSEEYGITSYGLNGDIIMPSGFNQICTFTTITENNNIESYGIYKMIPPEWEKLNLDNDISDKNMDLSKQPEKDEFLSLGYVIAPLISSNNNNSENNNNPDTKLYACVKRSCCRKIKNDNLKLLFVYPAVAFTDSEMKDTKPGKENNKDVMGMFSVWRTPLNTVFVKYMDESKIMNGKVLIEQIYLNIDKGEINENLYTRYGTIKKVIKERVKEFLNNIRLDKIVVLGILFNHTFEKVSKELKEYYTRFIISGEIPNSFILKKYLDRSSKENISYNDIHILINEIETVIGEKKIEIGKKQEKKLLEIKKRRILGLGENGSSSNNNNKEISFNALKRFETIKTMVAELAVNVENSNTLLDIIENIFDSGINYIIELDNLTYGQKIILYICCCLVKPNEDVYTIRNKCLVYEQIDEDRIKLQNRVGDEIRRFNNLREQIGNKAEDQCGTKDLNSINNAITNTYEKLMGQIGYIPNALSKLNKLELEEFTDGQLDFILGEIGKLILFIEGKCA